ncbi:TPA: restriction endonuclease subunit S [Escherichia coli]|uniref:Restriction endonuclease n=10 Tax=Enterobacteriaceae TaxID=543 RepID=A0AAJ1EJK8_ECOLX|nr:MULTISPECIES: restriction endonuclease subunit S [Enterobacteriaceae]MBR5629872.1 restriction endonuclease subunit S [Escherichia sp.]MVW42265.1 restriction endonuclease subunit S [Enterobacteriaceae bacterium TzEc013]AUL67316.1 restriction endonuclease [Escherichia coli]AVN08084.1 type I restriction modification DNA specificity domain protein [Escherichia coli]AWF17111.1 type I restriction modification DNA specificity domain protein [Escherichia coli]
MSVDTLRETFHINRISTSDLQDFLTAQTYRPEITQAKNHILSLKNCSLQAVCTKPIQQGKSPKYAEKGLKCIKPKNTNDMLVSIDDIDWIDSSTKDQIQKQKLAYGDIVITRSGSGTIGRASIYCYSEEAYTNDHLFVVRPDKADSHYICSFLNSFHGQRLLEAGVSGSTGQLNLSNEHIKSIPLFRPEHKAQKYIGDKVRQAEQLRAWAKRLEGMADRKIKDLFHFNLVDSLTLKPRRMKQQVLSAVSLAPEFARAADSQMTFRNSSKLSNFISKCKCGDPIKSEERVPGPYFYYGASGPIDTHTEFNFNGKYLIIAQDGSIGCANVADGKFWANNHVWVLKVKDEYDIESICRFLDKHFPCWKGVTTGSVVPKVTSENLLNILIPIDIAKNREIGSKLRLAVTTAAYAKKLTASAKTLVESLIEGQLTEQQLIQAQQALEDGDNSFDQAILSKLSAEGYAIEGATPLFSDVDELYSLLEEAA